MEGKKIGEEREVFPGARKARAPQVKVEKEREAVTACVMGGVHLLQKEKKADDREGDSRELDRTGCRKPTWCKRGRRVPSPWSAKREGQGKLRWVTRKTTVMRKRGARGGEGTEKKPALSSAATEGGELGERGYGRHNVGGEGLKGRA